MIHRFPGTNCMTDIERLSVVSYTDTLAPFKVRFVFRQPPLSYVSNIYSLPFSSYLWIGTAVCAAVSALTVCIAARWELRFGRVNVLSLTFLRLESSGLNTSLCYKYNIAYKGIHAHEKFHTSFWNFSPLNIEYMKSFIAFGARIRRAFRLYYSFC